MGADLDILAAIDSHLDGLAPHICARESARLLSAARHEIGLLRGMAALDSDAQPLYTRLFKLSSEMVSVGAAMDYYGGLAEWSQHGRELVGAAGVALEWAIVVSGENRLFKGIG